MKPKPIVEIQAGFSLAAAAIAIGLCGTSGALGVIVASGLGLIVTAGLAIRYHWLVRHRYRSRHRAVRDRIMIGCVAVGLALPATLGVAVLAGAGTAWNWPLRSVPAHFAVISASAVFAAMLTSSCVDWYLIRPFRDGVLGPPVCQMADHDDETVLFYAQAWIAHRTVAEVIGWGGTAIVLIIALVAMQNSTHNPTWSGIFTYLAPSGAVYLGIGGYLVRRLRYVPQYVQRPSPGLGRWVTGAIPTISGEERQIDGFVADVALGVGLQTITQEHRRKDVDLGDAWRLDSVQRPLCVNACERWIPHCDRGLREDEATTKPCRPAATVQRHLEKTDADAATTSP
ncbi:MAG: hypothetical protein ABSH36_02530 [Solirubrobacteraceae bacterium]